uniref:AB hydrolase-1 domain-containing protein n=1 Tax=Apteryx owenii TaxID=8824 RepID=A0A8B9P471_APTOW
MGNSRGNRWSRKHQNYSIDQDEFWMANFDLPAAINLIVKKTGQEKLYYNGYSQGTTIAFITFSAMPELAQKNKLYFALAPIATVKYARSPAIKLIYLPEILLRGLLGEREFLPQTECLRKLIVPLCSNRAFAKLCRNVFFSLGGREHSLNIVFQNQINTYTAQTPAGTSVQNIIHWSQVHSGKFQAYDLGSSRTWRNTNRYLLATPPLHNVGGITIPIAIPEWAHLDFIWGLDTLLCMYNEIIDLMQKYP